MVAGRDWITKWWSDWYKVKRVTLQGGWRYLVIHKQPTSGSFAELAQTGVIVGAVIPLK